MVLPRTIGETVHELDCVVLGHVDGASYPSEEEG